MVSEKVKSKKQKSLFWLLFQLSTFLFVWFIIYLSYFGDDSIIFKAVSQRLFSIPDFILLEVIGYWLLQLCFYMLFTIYIWALTRLIGKLFSWTWDNTRSLGLWLWCLGVLLLFIANNIFYPNSLFGMAIAVMLPRWLSEVTLIILLVVFSVASILALYEIFYCYARKVWLWVILIMLCGLFVFLKILPTIQINEPIQAGNYKQPNVFIIGLDALRPDRIHFYGYHKSQTPAIDSFLKQSIRFRHAITVLARTSPSWVSILTGQYPINNGVRFNLVPQQGLKLQNSLGFIFKRQGYKTIFSTDGRRFDFIDHNFGFDSVIGADATVSNFLMDVVDDTPLSDLIVNSSIGPYLYPYIYANRDIQFTYRPKAYLSLVERRMPKQVRQPIFMCIHFTLAHYPYYWAGEKPSKDAQPSELYNAAVARLDQQLAGFLQYLKKQHLLDNAIVVLMSDHGEALGLPGDRMLSRKTYLKGQHSNSNIFRNLNALQRGNTRLDESAGHGTDILSYSQINSVLAFKRYGGSPIKPRVVKERVALIDIKPTLLHMLRLSSPETDGVSLLPYFQGATKLYPSRMIFSEIGFTPIALKTSKISVQNAFFQSANMFAIQPLTDRIVMKKNIIRQLLKTKQRAVFYKNWVLALYPGPKDILFPVLLNRSTGKWTDDLTTNFANHSPAKKMFARLKGFYGAEITNYLPR